MSNQLFRLKWCWPFVLLWVVVLALCAYFPAIASTAGQSGANACDKRVQIKDYLAHLRDVAPIRSVPESGSLPFAPSGVSLRRLVSGPIVRPGTIGFAFHDEAINKPRHLNWVVTASLVKVSSDGRTIKTLGRKTERIGTRKLDYESVTGQRFRVSGVPAYHRVDLEFRDFHGRKLGSYSEYFRVMKSRYQVVMTLGDSDVNPGQTIWARIENRGTEPILAEVSITIEQRDEVGWSKIATVYSNGKRLNASAYVYGGETGPCFSFEVPADAEGGQFKITERIRRYLQNGQRRQASAVFGVGLSS